MMRHTIKAACCDGRLALIVPSVHPEDLFTRGAATTPPNAALTLSAPGKEPLKVCRRLFPLAGRLDIHLCLA